MNSFTLMSYDYCVYWATYLSMWTYVDEDRLYTGSDVKKDDNIEMTIRISMRQKAKLGCCCKVRCHN